VGALEITPLQKRAQKMFYKVWNGASKHIKAVLFLQRRPVEMPGFAIFAPIQKHLMKIDEESEYGGDVSASHKPLGEIDYLISNGGIKGGKDKSSIVKLILHNDFVDKCGDQLAEPTKESNVIMLNST
jgi:hypothetical protein